MVTTACRLSHKCWELFKTVRSGKCRDCGFGSPSHDACHFSTVSSTCGMLTCDLLLVVRVLLHVVGKIMPAATADLHMCLSSFSVYAQPVQKRHCHYATELMTNFHQVFEVLVLAVGCVRAGALAKAASSWAPRQTLPHTCCTTRIRCMGAPHVIFGCMTTTSVSRYAFPSSQYQRHELFEPLSYKCYILMLTH